MTLSPASQRQLFSNLTNLRDMLATYQGQIATGKRAESYADLGIDRTISISSRRIIANLDGYKSTINTVQNRLNAMDITLSRLSSINQEVKTLTNDRVMRITSGNQTEAQANARLYVDEFINHLNTDYAGRKMFSGRDLSEDAVEVPDVILNGDGQRAGLITATSERLQADIGNFNIGRLNQSIAADTITLAEDGVHNFGFKLNSLSTTSSNITVTPPTGSPSASTIQFTALPAENDVVNLRLDMPDGTISSIRLTATTGTPGPNQFQIGVDPAATAANFNTALNGALQNAANSDLTAASNIQAAEDFFGNPPQRISGTPATATTLVAGTASNTVLWYQGEDEGDSSRLTAVAVIDDGQNIGYGVRANEAGISKSLQALFAMSAATFSNTDPNAASRYSALMDRVRNTLEDGNNGSGGISSIRGQLGTVNNIMSAANERHSIKNNLMEDAIGAVENISIEEVATKLLDAQNKLQASYQVTASISSLSLVDYLR